MELHISEACCEHWMPRVPGFRTFCTYVSELEVEGQGISESADGLGHHVTLHNLMISSSLLLYLPSSGAVFLLNAYCLLRYGSSHLL